MGRIWTWREETAGALWDEARMILKRNGVIAVPTETFFGLAVNPFQEEALGRLFALKDRAPGKPVLVLVDGPEMLNQVAREVPGLARRLMEKFWPGPLTIIFPSLPHLPRRLTGGAGTIAVRQPRQELTCRLIAALGFPITGTSANRAGGRPLARADEVAREFGDHLDLILETGPCPGGLPSTIVDITKVPPRLVRAGAVPTAELAEIMPELLSCATDILPNVGHNPPPPPGGWGLGGGG
jgi:L-threonylcarbamoyladenylate synthase